MKNTTTPTKTEYLVPEDTLLVSKTNQKGVIIYCNNAFINISGYSESELLMKPHNVVRHPEMPKIIFHLLWQTISAKREFNGYIKNLSKDGGYYWVFANITPSFNEANELLGYNSIRRKPDIEKLNYIQNLYLELFELEQQASAVKSIDESGAKLDSILNSREMGYDEFVLSL